MKDYLTKMVPVAPSDRFPFRCRRCGECCRHVKQSVPLEALDAFRLAKYLRDRDETIRTIDDVLIRYAEPVLLHESGYSVFMLKTVGTEDTCIFLKDNRCTIQEAKPKACLTYPLSVGPDGKGGLDQYLSLEQPHHFNGPDMSVKKWIEKRCHSEDREFWQLDIDSGVEQVRLLEKIPEEEKRRAMLLFFLYRYSDFDLDEEFIPQFKRNSRELLKALKKLAGEQKPQ